MNDETIIMNNAESVIAAGAAISAPRSPAANLTQANGIPYVVLPEGYQVSDLEDLLPIPTRARASVTVGDADSFIAYVKKHGIRAECTIYADIDAEASRFNLEAVINDHGADVPGWRDHRCSLAPKQSVEWRRWLGKHKQPMSQSEFATWLEDNLADVATMEGRPNGAQMLELAIGFERTAEKRLKSRLNLQSGGFRLEYVDDEDKDTRTSLQVFERFILGLPVFDGSASAYPLEARLKYREKDGKVSFWYELIRPDRVFKTAVTEELDAIKEATGFMVINGRP